MDTFMIFLLMLPPIIITSNMDIDSFFGQIVVFIVLLAIEIAMVVWIIYLKDNYMSNKISKKNSQVDLLKYEKNKRKENIYRMIRKKNIILVPYCAFTASFIASVCLLINIFLNNYIYEIKAISIFGMIMLMISLIYFTRYVAIERRNKILITKINKINLTILKAIKCAEIFLQSDNHNRTKYNKYRKIINKTLSKRNTYKTFEPVFEEDEKVMDIIALMNNLGKKDLYYKYEEYKRLFKKEKTFNLLSKATKKQPSEEYIHNIYNIIALLKD